MVTTPRAHFDLQLQRLQNDVLMMGSMVDRAVEHAVASLKSRDRELAERVITLAARTPSPPIQFQSYAEAYDEDFEDIRRRVPDLSRLKSTIDYQPQFDLDAILRSLIQKGPL